MFLAMLLVCATNDVRSCEVFYNTEKVFVTELACEQELDVVKSIITSPQTFFIQATCLQLPGKSA
jgi:hypothetical protein